MAKHMECGCWLTDDLAKVEGVCDAHKEWQMAMSARAYEVASNRAPEHIAPTEVAWMKENVSKEEMIDFLAGRKTQK